MFGGGALNSSRSKTRLYAAMERGEVIPKTPSEVVATPPRLIGLSPLERRRELIRQRAKAMGASRG